MFAQSGGEIGDPSDVPRVQHSQGGLHVGVCNRHRVGDGADRVVELPPGVPDRIPDLVSDLHNVGPTVVQHHDVQVATGAEFAAPVTADRDECNAVGVAEQFAQPRIGLGGSFGS